MSSEPGSPRAAGAARLRVVMARLSRWARQQQVAGGLTASQLSALAAIECHAALRLGDLAAAEGVTPATMTRLVAPLVEEGLVERSPDPQDGRSVRVALTPAGVAHLAELRRRGTGLLSRALDRLSEPDYARLEAALPVLEALLEDPARD